MCVVTIALSVRKRVRFAVSRSYGSGVVSQKLARSETSRGLQYLGLGIAVAAEALLLQPKVVAIALPFAGQVAGALSNGGFDVPGSQSMRLIEARGGNR